MASRTAIIDIGSNSIRLVVYEGPARLPATLFNEKVMAGLGRGVAEAGRLSDEGLAAAREALARFVAIAREMQVASLRIVATAAVRDASNGDELLHHVQSLGEEVELLTGEQEALGAGYGVLSGIPDADGIVGDLGGGSLELVRIAAGTVTDRASFPLGVLRLPAIRARGKDALDRTVSRLLGEAGWKGRGEELPFYLVGGSWRALARLDMHLTGYPLPVIHQYEIDREALARLRRTISHSTKSALRATPGMSSARAGNLDDATALLATVLKQLKSRTAITSALGLREGLLYGAVDRVTRQQDPLIVAAREEGRQFGRFPEHGDLLNRWIAPLFAGEIAEMNRLRHAACLLADVGWRANPEFRAERGIEVALHGNWVAIDAAGRAILAQALFTSLCGDARNPDPLARLAAPADLAQAAAWGFAMRLGQRLSGGIAGPLERSSIKCDRTALRLHLGVADRALYGDAVQRRHKAAAGYLGLEPALG